MESDEPRTVTRLLRAWSAGDAVASEKLLDLLYADLKVRARRCLRRERVGHTLQPTALVHEAYLRLAGQARVAWRNRSQFLALAAVMMRRVIVDHARGRAAGKRGRSWARITLDEAVAASPGLDMEILDLDAALTELAGQDPRQSRLVELRVFGGLSYEEAAEVLGVAPITARRDWTIARAWLFRRLSRGGRAPAGR